MASLLDQHADEAFDDNYDEDSDVDSMLVNDPRSLSDEDEPNLDDLKKQFQERHRK